MSADSLSFRRATRADVPAVVALVERAFRGEESRAGWTTEADLLDGQRTDADEVASLIEGHDTCIVLAERDGAPVGCVKVGREGDAGVIGMVSVAPALQRSGIGHALLLEAERLIFGVWQQPRATMTVIVQREALIAWYERRGYRQTGERRPFPYGQPRFGLPRRPDLAFIVLEKTAPGG